MRRALRWTVVTALLAIGAPALASSLTDMSAVGTAPTAPAVASTLPSATDEAIVVDAGNKICPVTGEPVSGKDFVIYKGTSYGLCCPSCKELFLKDPETYLKKLKEKGEIK